MAGRYSTSSEYVRELIRKEQNVQTLRNKLSEGAASPLEGPADEAYSKDCANVTRKRARE